MRSRTVEPKIFMFYKLLIIRHLAASANFFKLFRTFANLSRTFPEPFRTFPNGYFFNTHTSNHPVVKDLQLFLYFHFIQRSRTFPNFREPFPNLSRTFPEPFRTFPNGHFFKTHTSNHPVVKDLQLFLYFHFIQRSRTFPNFSELFRTFANAIRGRLCTPFKRLGLFVPLAYPPCTLF